ncbi:MAG: SprT-like domain-containing protein [Chthoniobacterales bacterium]
MLPPEQLALDFTAVAPTRAPELSIEEQGRTILREAGALVLAETVSVRWEPRLQTTAGRADWRQRCVTLNPRLREYGAAEIDRTLRHELAHLLAHAQAGRRRIQPHGPEWRAACHALGIGGEPRCHTLPFPIRQRARRLLYRCRSCAREYPRVRRFKRRTACLACCRAYNGGRYDSRFILQLVE